MRIREIHRTIKELDDNIKPGDVGYKAALFVLASMTRPHNGDELAKATGIPREQAREFARNCRLNKIWEPDGRIGHSGWFNKKSDNMAFWLDINCVIGWMRRDCAEA